MCITARHFNKKCCDTSNPHIFRQVQLIESVEKDVTVEGKLWKREKYWQCQLFNNTHGLNSVSDLYCYFCLNRFFVTYYGYDNDFNNC